MPNDNSHLEERPEGDDPAFTRQEVRELLFRARHFRHWEDEMQTTLLLVYYCYTKAVHDVVRTGSIAEAVSITGASRSSIIRANAVGARSLEWFHEKWMHRSEAGDRLTRRHVETLAMTAPSKGRAVLADAMVHVEPSRKMEEMARRKKVPPRDFLPRPSGDACQNLGSPACSLRPVSARVVDVERATRLRAKRLKHQVG